MNLLPLFVFKSPTRVDWKRTDENISYEVVKLYPNARASENAMACASVSRAARAIVKKYGVKRTYDLANEKPLPVV